MSSRVHRTRSVSAPAGRSSFWTPKAPAQSLANGSPAAEHPDLVAWEENARRFGHRLEDSRVSGDSPAPAKAADSGGSLPGPVQRKAQSASGAAPAGSGVIQCNDDKKEEGSNPRTPSSYVSDGSTVSQGVSKFHEFQHKNFLSNFTEPVRQEGLRQSGRISNATFWGNTMNSLGKFFNFTGAMANARNQYQTSQAETMGGRSLSAILAGSRSFFTPPLVSVPDTLTGGHLAGTVDRGIDKAVTFGEKGFRDMKPMDPEEIRRLMMFHE